MTTNQQQPPPAMPRLLLPGEADLRASIEADIKLGLETWFSVSAGLAAIRAKRLYRNTHATFEDYCEEVLQINATSAQREIERVETASR